MLFYEKQKFTQPWLWALLFLVLAPFVWGVIKQIIMGSPWGDNPMSDISLLLITLIPLGLIWFFRSITLETRISEEAIDMNFSPLGKTSLRWDKIEKAEVIRYGFVGYGYRISMKHGTIYNVKGNKGIQLHMANNRKILIGTQRPEELAEIVRQCMGED